MKDQEVFCSCKEPLIKIVVNYSKRKKICIICGKKPKK